MSSTVNKKSNHKNMYKLTASFESSMVLRLAPMKKSLIFNYILFYTII